MGSGEGAGTVGQKERAMQTGKTARAWGQGVATRTLVAAQRQRSTDTALAAAAAAASCSSLLQPFLHYLQRKFSILFCR